MDRAPSGSTANSYEILAKLATGGMAELYLARVASVAGVDRHVVLKRILRDRAGDDRFVRMFLDEARLVARLQHPNIAQIQDVGKLGDSYFFTMEYIHGEDLRAILARTRATGQALPLSIVLTITAGLAAGLHHAHERLDVDGKPLGIVHRDVSPANVMISFDGTTKLVDFGVAKATVQTTETVVGTVKGKVGYMSPEQCLGNPIDRRTDVFSIGIVMWEMLIGTRLFKRDSDFQTLTAICNDPVPPPSSLRPDVPPEIDAIIARLTAKSADERYQTADEALEAIEAAAAKVGAMISNSAVARFMRDLFGNKPEPWLELHDRPPLTVTGELVGDIGARGSNALEKEFAGVPDLSRGPYGSTPRGLPVVAAPITGESGRRSSSASQSGLGSLIASLPVGREASFSDATPAKSRKARVLIIVSVAVAAVAFAVEIAMTRGKHTARPEDTVAVHAVDAAVPENTVVMPATNATVPVDAALPVDAGHAETPRPDAGAQDPLDAAFAAQDYKRVVALCTASASAVAKQTRSCVIAACKVASVPSARRWQTKLSTADRPGVVAACAASKVSLDQPTGHRPRPDRDCEKNPLDCQH